MTQNIFEYFTSTMGFAPEDESLRDLPVESVCGRDCKRAIDAGAALMAAVDRHPDVVADVRSAVERSVSIFWVG